MNLLFFVLVISAVLKSVSSLSNLIRNVEMNPNVCPCLCLCERLSCSLITLKRKKFDILLLVVAHLTFKQPSFHPYAPSFSLQSLLAGFISLKDFSRLN